jgi:hypothetical protein
MYRRVIQCRLAYPIKPGLMHLRADFASVYRWNMQRKASVPCTYWVAPSNSIRDK